MTFQKFYEKLDILCIKFCLNQFFASFLTFFCKVFSKVDKVLDTLFKLYREISICIEADFVLIVFKKVLNIFFSKFLFVF